MSNSSNVLRLYEAIAEISGQMVLEARARRWDEVVKLGERYQAAVESLRDLEQLQDDDRQARRELLTKILDDDAMIRHLAAPELGRLGALMGNMKRQHAVLQTYCAAAINTHS
jgi:flagellar protein FliT